MATPPSPGGPGEADPGARSRPDAHRFDDYRVDHLFLLIGANPLPNYVAGRLLARDDATVYLLHSTPAAGRRHTGHHADFLRDALRAVCPQLTIEPRDVHEADSDAIARGAGRILDRLPGSAVVGLNYTGGTKPMAVHIYRAVAERFPDAVFSYLDAADGALYVEGERRPIPLAREVELTLPALAALHGYDLAALRREPRHRPLLVALADAHQSQDAYKAWREWQKGRPITTLPDPAQYPALAAVRGAMDEVCGGQATPETLAAILRDRPEAKLSSCEKWFSGEWLEEWTLTAIHEAAAKTRVSDYGIDLKPQPKLLDPEGQPAKEFQLDAAALIGYQLIAISCKRASDDADLKTAFFETFLRGRQLGGDEARAVLVCTNEQPEALQRDVERDWQAWDQVRVFGRRDLPRLPDLFLDWFRKLNP